MSVWDFVVELCIFLFVVGRLVPWAEIFFAPPPIVRRITEKHRRRARKLLGTEGVQKVRQLRFKHSFGQQLYFQ